MLQATQWLKALRVFSDVLPLWITVAMGLKEMVEASGFGQPWSHLLHLCSRTSKGHLWMLQRSVD